MRVTPELNASAGFDVTGCETSSGRSVPFRPERVMVESLARSTFEESVIVIRFDHNVSGLCGVGFEV